jgi:glycosyltransferase involved in cell wall biosynthesis
MQNNHLRVMQVIDNLRIGGAQEVVRTLAENLTEAGCPTVVCAFKDGPLRKEIERLGIPVEILPERCYSILALPLYVMEMFRLRQALAGLVKKYHINVIQTHLLRSLDFLVLSLRLPDFLKRNPGVLLEPTPLVFWTFQNAYFTLREDHLARNKWLLHPKRWTYRLLYRLAARWVNGFIAVSDEVKAAILAELGSESTDSVRDKISVICNSVDFRRYQPASGKSRGEIRSAIRRQLGLAENACLAVVVATFKEQKGHRYLIEGAPGAVLQFPDLHILLVGDGDLREKLLAQANASGLNGHLRFLGYRSDIPDLLAASDLFILPSLWEGLSMALVEAMASGLPVIATEVSGTKQVMVSGETGLLIPPGDARRLKEAMIQLLSDPARARAMGEAGQKRVEKFFGSKKQAEDHLSLFTRELAR